MNESIVLSPMPKPFRIASAVSLFWIACVSLALISARVGVAAPTSAAAAPTSAAVPTPAAAAPSALESAGDSAPEDRETREDALPPEEEEAEILEPPDFEAESFEGFAGWRTVPPLFFGLQMHSLLAEPSHHRRAAETAARLGARFVRDECFWHEVEKEKGIYKIPEVPLQNLRTNKEMGLETLLILNYTNDHYDDGHAPVSPEAVAAFGAYCRHMAAELKDLCRHFEIWNEPNTDGFWRPRKDPLAYARLFETAAREIRRGNPEALVLGGSLSGIDTEFMTTVCQTADCTLMDFFTVHPYCTPRSPGQAAIFPGMDELRHAIFPDPERRRPLWMTELGYPTNLEGGVEEWRQAEVLAQTYLLGATRPELEGIVWYWMGPDGKDPFWAEDRFGLIRQHFAGRKPAAWPFDTLARLLPGLRVGHVVQTIPEIPDSRVLRFWNKHGRHYTAIYVEEGEYAVNIVHLDSVEVHPLTGAGPTTLSASQEGPIQISISPMPVVIETKHPPALRKARRPLFLHARSANLPRGSEERLHVASRQLLRRTGLLGVLLWPGRLVAEDTPAAPPWSVESARESEAAACFLRVPPDAPTETVPFAAYWVPPGADRPAARLARALTVVAPVTLDIRGLLASNGRPQVAVAVGNATERTVSVDLRLDIETGASKEFQVAALAPGTQRVVSMPVESRPAPDAVLRVEAAARVGEVQTHATQYVSYLFSPRFETPPEIDGSLADWTVRFPPIHLGDPKQTIDERLPWRGPEDSSARVWTGWDDDWFYIGAEIIDDIHVEEATGFAVYNNDGLEIYIDVDRENGRTRTSYSDKQFQLGLFPTQGEDVVYDFQHTRGPLPGARIRIERQPTRAHRHPMGGCDLKPSMIIEAAIPFAALGTTPWPGLELGFTVALNDDDTPDFIHPFLQDRQMQWSRQRNAWRRPSAFASLWLAPPPPSGKTTAPPPLAEPDGTP